MSRVPEIERELLRAAQRQEVGAQRRAMMRVSRSRRMLLVAVAGLASSGVAWAAVGLLEGGEPVPRAEQSSGLEIAADVGGFQVAAVRAPDPQGGPDWAVGTFPAEVDTSRFGKAGSVPVGVRCVVVARVQEGRLGIVGRDGAFGNDGRFHPLRPGAQTSNSCAGASPDGGFRLFRSGPPIPASGFTGAPGGAIGGCRERVDLDGPTVSPQTRRKLRGVPICEKRSLRTIVSGFAGPDAKTAAITFDGRRTVLDLRPEDDGAFLFVLPGSATRPDVTITASNGTDCKVGTSSDSCAAP